jgi:hypothetical protein
MKEMMRSLSGWHSGIGNLCNGYEECQKEKGFQKFNINEKRHSQRVGTKLIPSVNSMRKAKNNSRSIPFRMFIH